MFASNAVKTASRCALIGAFFLSCAVSAFAAQENETPVFSEAPTSPLKKVDANATPANDDSAGAVVDLKKLDQAVEPVSNTPPPSQVIPASTVTKSPKTNDAPAETVSLEPGMRSFKELLTLPDSQLDIAEAILALGSERSFELAESAGKTLKRLDDIAAKAREQLPANPDVSDIFDALYDVVLTRRPIESAHDERIEDYDLSCAVFEHKGSCLSMGIMALAVAQRLHAPVSGAQCPNHFFLRGTGIVKGNRHEVPLNFDVTRPTPDNWAKLDDAFYRRLRHFDSKAEDAGEYLRPLSVRQVISAFLASRSGFLAREHQFELAFNDAERALQLNPRNVIAMINAGFTKESQHNLEDAERYYRAAIEIDPQSVRALNNLAFVKSRDKKSSVFDTKAAEKLIDKAIKIDPDQSYLYATRGEVFAARGEYREATRAMQTAVNLAPKNASYRERYMSLREHLRSEK